MVNVRCRRGGGALFAAGAAATIADGVQLARETIDSGKALATLEAYIEASNR